MITILSYRSYNGHADAWLRCWLTVGRAVTMELIVLMFHCGMDAVAYPELISGGSKSRNVKWLVKDGASKGCQPPILFLTLQPENPPGYATGMDHNDCWRC